MVAFSYLTLLIISLCGLAVIDYRYKLAFFYDKAASAVALLFSVGLFLIWDGIGIALGIFFIGNTQYLSGIELAPELPLEEIFFLALLCYNALILWRAGERLWQTT